MRGRSADRTGGVRGTPPSGAPVSREPAG